MEEFLILLKLLWKVVRFILELTTYVICAALLVVACLLPWRLTSILSSTLRPQSTEEGFLGDWSEDFRWNCLASFFCTLLDVICVPLGLLGALVPTRTYAYFADSCKILADDDECSYNFDLRMMWFCLFFCSAIDLFCLMVCIPSLVVPTRLYAAITITAHNAKEFRECNAAEDVRLLWLCSPFLGIAEVVAFILGTLGLLSVVRSCQTVKDVRTAFAEGQKGEIFEKYLFHWELVQVLCVNGASVVVDIVFLPLLLALALGCWRLKPVAMELRHGFSWGARRLILLQFLRLMVDLILALPLALVCLSWRTTPPEVVGAICCSGGAAEGCERSAPVSATQGGEVAQPYAVVAAGSEGSDPMDLEVGEAGAQGGPGVEPAVLGSTERSSAAGEPCTLLTDCHLAILRSAGLMALDVLVSPLILLLCLVTFYRLPALTGDLRGTKFHAEVLKQCFEMLIDFPFLMAGLVLLCTVYRVDIILPACQKSSSLTAEERRKLVGVQFLYLLRDATMLLPLALVTLTLYRLPSMLLGIKARMSKLLLDDPEMRTLEVRAVVPEPQGLPSLVVRASKAPNLAGVTSMRLQVAGDEFWAAVASAKGSMAATAARALLPLVLQDGKEVDFGCVERGREEVTLTIELQRAVKRKVALKLLESLPGDVEFLLQLEAQLECKRSAVLLAIPLQVAQMRSAIASADGRLRSVGWLQAGESVATAPDADGEEDRDPQLARLRGSAAGARRRDSWWSPVVAEASQVVFDLVHLLLFVLLLAFPWRFAMAVMHMLETHGQRMARLACDTLVALDYWETACRHIASRVVPLTNSYAKSAFLTGSSSADKSSGRDSQEEKNEQECEHCVESCIACCCCVFCPCCPNYADVEFDSDDDFFVDRHAGSRSTRKSSSELLDRRLKNMSKPLTPARTLLRAARKRWPEEPQWSELARAVDARLVAWSEAFFWMLLLPEVHLLWAEKKITQEDHSRLCQMVRKRAVPQVKGQAGSSDHLRAAFLEQSVAARQESRSRKKAVSLCFSVIREHLLKGITDILAIPAILLLVLSMYRLRNLSVGVAKPFNMARFKSAVKVQVIMLGSDIMRSLQLLLLTVLLVATVVKLPDYLWGLRPARGLRKNRDWALAKVSEIVVGIMELVMMLFVWKAYKLVVSAAVFVGLTPGTLLALALPSSWASRLRFGLGVVVWFGVLALGLFGGEWAAFAALTLLLVMAFVGLSCQSKQGWAVRREGDWWSPEVRWTSPNLLELAAILTEAASLLWAGFTFAEGSPDYIQLPADVRLGFAGVGVVVVALLHMTLPMVSEEVDQETILAHMTWRCVRQLLHKVLFLPTVAVLAPMVPLHSAWIVALAYYLVVSLLASAAWDAPLTQQAMLDIRTLGLNSSGRQLLAAAAVLVAVHGWRSAFLALAAISAAWTLLWAPRGASVLWAELLRFSGGAIAFVAAFSGDINLVVGFAVASMGLSVVQAAAARLLRCRQLRATKLPAALEGLGRIQQRVALWGGESAPSASVDTSASRAAAVLLDLEERMPFDRLQPEFLLARRRWRAGLIGALDYEAVLAGVAQLEKAVLQPPTRILLQQVLERVPLAGKRNIPEALAAQIVELAVPPMYATPPQPPCGWEHGKLDLADARRTASNEASFLSSRLDSMAGSETQVRRSRARQSSSVGPLAPEPEVMGSPSR